MEMEENNFLANTELTLNSVISQLEHISNSHMKHLQMKFDNIKSLYLIEDDTLRKEDAVLKKENDFEVKKFPKNPLKAVEIYLGNLSYDENKTKDILEKLVETLFPELLEITTKAKSICVKSDYDNINEITGLLKIQYSLGGIISKSLYNILMLELINIRLFHMDFSENIQNTIDNYNDEMSQVDARQNSFINLIGIQLTNLQNSHTIQIDKLAKLYNFLGFDNESE